MSYLRQLGLEEEPFSTSPDPAYFFESKNHQAALINLINEITLKRGLSVVIGDVGTGKSTLCRKLIQLLSAQKDFLVHMILDPSYSSDELFLRGMLQEFRLEPPSTKDSVLEMKTVLKNYLFQEGLQSGRTIVLIVDEAQTMSKSALEILRVFLNYETNQYKLLQIVLFSQIELLPTLTNMDNFTDRISLKCILKPLDITETRALIRYRLLRAGFRGKNDLFLAEAIKEIHEITKGYPRKITMLCHRALRYLATQNNSVITARMISEIARQDIRNRWRNSNLLQNDKSLN